MRPVRRAFPSTAALSVRANPSINGTNGSGVRSDASTSCQCAHFLVFRSRIIVGGVGGSAPRLAARASLTSRFAAASFSAGVSRHLRLRTALALKSHDVAASAQRVEVIGPCLHHFSPLGDALRTVVYRADFIFVGVRK